MKNQTVQELILTAKNATSEATRQVAAEVAAVKNAAKEASGAAAQMQAACERAFTAISNAVQESTAALNAHIALQKSARGGLGAQQHSSSGSVQTDASQTPLGTAASSLGNNTSCLQGLMGAYVAASGAATLFARDSETLQSVQTRLLTTVSALAGVLQLSNALQATATLRTNAVKVVTDLWRGAQNLMNGSLVAGSTAAKLLWGAISMGATVVIGAAIAAVSRWIDKNKEARQAAEAQAQAIEQANNAARDSAASTVSAQMTEYSKLQEAWQALGDNMTAKRKFIDENKSAFDALGVSISSVSDAENLLITNQNAFTTSLKNKAIQIAATAMAAKSYEEAIQLMLDAERHQALTPQEDKRAQETARKTVMKRHKIGSQAWAGSADYITGKKSNNDPVMQEYAKDYQLAYAAMRTKIRKEKQASAKQKINAKQAEGDQSIRKATELTQANQKTYAEAGFRAIKETTAQTIPAALTMPTIPATPKTAQPTSYQHSSKEEKKEQFADVVPPRLYPQNTAPVQPAQMPTSPTQLPPSSLEIVASVRLRMENLEKAQQEIAKLREMLQLDSLSEKERSGIEASIGSWETYTESLGGAEQKQGTVRDKAGEVANTMSAVGGVVSSLAAVTDENTAGWLNWGAGVINSVAQAVPQIAKLVIANTATAATGAAASVASIPIVGWIMAGLAVTSVLASLAAVPKFANGGIAYGPTLGLFGEYSGAQHNPEVVAPLDRLQAMLQPAGGGGDVRFRIEGRTLVGVIEKEKNHKNRTK